MAALTVKGQAAGAEQRANMLLCCQLGKSMGATSEQLAGAIATMIQESDCFNLKGGDRDSAGLFQQRPSVGAWGSYADVTNPPHACRAFLTPYLHYCRAGQSVLAASNSVQRSAYPTAPARWLPEARKNVSILTGSKDFGDVTAGYDTSGSARAQPYEFSRGNSGSRETSWDCMGRLASEVNWRRFMRGGALWFVSDAWLSKQTPRFAFAAGVRGILSITFDSDARRNAAEATVSALAKRWQVLPGDVVTVSGQGPGDGLWLVYSTRRSLWDETTEIALRRPAPAKPEPAPTMTSSVTVAGSSSLRLNGGSGPAAAQRLYAACQAISDKHYPYVWGGGHGAAGTPSGGGYDCSGSVCAALAAAELGFRVGGPVSVSGAIASSWGQSGPGQYVTVWASAEHVWIQFKGVGRAWRFDTSPHACGGDGPQLRYCPRSTATFTPRHWPGL